MDLTAEERNHLAKSQRETFGKQLLNQFVELLSGDESLWNASSKCLLHTDAAGKYQDLVFLVVYH